MTTNLTYDQLKTILTTDLNIGCPASADFGDKIALFGLIAYLTNALKQKKPDVDCYKVIRMCTKDRIVEDNLVQALALITEWLTWNCTKFPNFGIEVKDMPKKISALIQDLMPF